MNDFYLHLLNVFKESFKCLHGYYVLYFIAQCHNILTEKNQSRTNGPINAHLTIAQV